MTKATYTKPCQVATQVKSDTHSAFGHGARNRRFTRSAGHGAPLSGTVVLVSLPRTTPRRAIRRIRRATVQRATGAPSRRSCRHTFLTP